LPEDGKLFGWCLLPAIPSSVAFARGYVRMMIARHGLGDVVDADAAELVLSEMVTNALQHAYHDKPSLADTVHIGIGPWRGGLLVSAGDMSDETPTVRSISMPRSARAAADAEDLGDHFREPFAQANDRDAGGTVHAEAAGPEPTRACLCGFAAADITELDAHFIAVFTSASGIAPGGTRHGPVETATA